MTEAYNAGKGMAEIGARVIAPVGVVEIELVCPECAEGASSGVLVRFEGYGNVRPMHRECLEELEPTLEVGVAKTVSFAMAAENG